MANLIIFISKDGGKKPKNHNFLWIFSLFVEKKITKLQKFTPKGKNMDEKYHDDDDKSFHSSH